MPTEPNQAGAAENRMAWRALRRWGGPVLTLFSDSDPITQGGERAFERLLPGANGQPHTIIKNAGHFLQEDAGEQLAEHLLAFMQTS